MVTPADWIKVELSADEVERAEDEARGQLYRAIAARRASYGSGDLRTFTLGAYGELAVSKYLDLPYDPGTCEDDVARGYDVGGYQVRCGDRANYGLSINTREQIGSGDYILALAHLRPVMHLAGWINAAIGAQVARWRHDHGVRWLRVDQSDLQPLPEQNGYTRQHLRLVDDSESFWCEHCHSHHPIGEHSDCRAGTSRQMLLLERSRRIRAQLHPLD